MTIFDHDHPKIIKVIFNCLEFTSACIKNFTVPWLKMGLSNFWPCQTNNCLLVWICITMRKMSVCSIDSFMRYSQFKSTVTRVATLVFDDTHPNMFLSTLKFQYQYGKEEAMSSLCSRDIFDSKILQPDWHRLVWPILNEKQTNRITAFNFY